jgi:hypothetical protein
MPTRPSRSTPADTARSRVCGPLRRVALVGAVLATGAALAACGSTPSPGASGTAPPEATAGPNRPVTAQPVDADGALSCPTRLASADGLTVPEKPQGLDGNARLLPERDPTSLVVCAYPTMSVTAATPPTAPYRLTARSVITAAQRRQVVDLFSWAPRWNGQENVCTMMAGDETAYLVGARYDDAVVWVAAKADANACSKATNGDFTSGAPLGVPLRALLAATPDPAGARCDARTFGRLGDDRTLAPEGAPLVTVCRTAADGSTKPTTFDASRSAQVVAALRALPTRPTSHTCNGAGARTDGRFHLVLTYPEGPAVRVDVDPDCAPPVRGGGVESAQVGDVARLVEQWSPRIPGPGPDAAVSSGGSGAVISPERPVAPDATSGPTGGAGMAPGSPGAGSRTTTPEDVPITP